MDKILEFAGNHPLLVLALVVSFLVAIFYELRRKASGTINIEAIDAVKLINNGAVVVDLAQRRRLWPWPHRVGTQRAA